MSIRRLLFLAIVVSISFVAGLVLTGRLRTAEQADARPAEAPAAPRAAAPAAPAPAPATTAPGPDFTGVAAQTVRAVTNISSLQFVERPNSPFANDPFFQYFFGDDMMGERSRRELSLGSGVIVSPDGYILTNNHVIGQQGRGSQVTVVFGDKREVRAHVVRYDDWTDIALLKVNLASLPVIPWGNSSNLKVAEWVLANRNPFQLKPNVTARDRVRARAREHRGRDLQGLPSRTNAAINLGKFLAARLRNAHRPSFFGI